MTISNTDMAIININNEANIVAVISPFPTTYDSANFKKHRE